MSEGENQPVPFNQLQGTAPHDIPAYSNEYDDFISFEAAYTHGVFTGFKWQCVEFARRWLLLRKSCIFRNIGTAAEMWSELTHVERVTDGKKFSVRTYSNGAVNKPICETFLIYPRSEEIPYGHIAVICEVQEDFIRVAEQNYRFHSWPDHYSRQIPLVHRDGLYYIEDYYQAFGWMDVVETEELQPLDQSNSCQILKKYREPLHTGSIQRLALPDSYSDSDDSSFASEIRAQKWLGKSPDNGLVYCKVDEDFLVTLSSTSNELYRLLLATTAHIIHNDKILRDFRIPEAFWAPIRQAWVNESHSDLLDHLDLKFDGSTLKLTEYNADHTSTIVGCATLQERWIEQMNLDCHFSVNFQLHRLLVRHWKQLQLSSSVHIIIDDQDEKKITALYMQNVLKEAGIESKLCHVPTDLHWDDATIVDSDGDPVKVVWGLWKWKRIFEEHNARWEGDRQPLRGEHPCLSDILLNSDIRILEPLWKSITTHPAVLSILNTRFPDHPNLQGDNGMDHEEETQCLPLMQWSVDDYHDALDCFPVDDGQGSPQPLPKNHNVDRDETIVSWMVAGLFSGLGIRNGQERIGETKYTTTVC